MAITFQPGQDLAAFALQVKKASDDELGDLLDRQREAVLTALVGGMPAVFRGDRAGTLDAVVQWRIAGHPEGGDDVFEVRIAAGRCAVVPAGTSTPRLVLQVGPLDFVKMATGNAGARMLFLRGRLRARGDLGLVNRLPSLFDVPRP